MTNKRNLVGLICKLTEFHITDEGDFIPKGALVEVLSWSDSDMYKNHLLCRTSVYLFCDTTPEELEGWSGNVGTGLYINVGVDKLEFHSYLPVAH